MRSRYVENENGLVMHVLEAGEPGRPGVLLLHGFPELAYSWRKVMPALAAAGFHVVAPDQRGYGRTTGWDAAYDGDVHSFRLLNLVRDALGLVTALGWRSVAAVIGHDFGAAVAANCALLHPDVFRSVVLMSAPFGGPAMRDIGAELAALPRPRKHYQWYYSTRAANDNMWHCAQGVHAFLRAYFHMKSADWKGNKPFRLAGWSAAELAKMPTYYIMDLAKTMAETVAPEMPAGPAPWLGEDELAVYSAEYARTGFQGGLQWYRCRIEDRNGDLNDVAGRAIEVPSMFIAGASDWGIYQVPGAFEQMQQRALARMRGCHLVAGAGHWVQQERSDEVTRLLLELLA
ncbi:MAG TPA: alpha/beta hydrolase [Burkholderiales bacterium]|nr:alpha/beta hydrolase [Burkholderiales bacterium]